MSEDDLAVVRGAREAVQGDDLEALLFAPNIEFVRFGRNYRGIDAFRETWSRPVAEEGPEGDAKP